MDCNKQLHIKVETPACGAAHRDAHCGHSHRVLTGTKANLVISEYVGRVRLDFLRESIPASRNNYTPPLGHNTE